MNLSDHTQQMNIWIALCKKDKNFPNPLRKLKYNPEIIDPSFILKGKKINPDLILTSKKFNHSIIIDCKSKTLKKEQLDKYIKLKNNSMILFSHGIVDIVNPSHFSIDIAISSFQNIIDNLNMKKNEFSLLKFIKDDDNKLKEINLYENYDFQFKKLRESFPISDDQGFIIPTEYYPFDVFLEDQEQFIISLFQSIISLAVNRRRKKFDIDELLVDCHPFWSIIDENKKSKFRKKIKRFMSFYEKELQEHIEKIADSKNDEWKNVAPSFQSLQRKCEKLIFKTKEDLKQSNINEY